MADIVAYVGNHRNPFGYRDGDVIRTYSNMRILNTYAQHFCHPTLQLFNSDGLRYPNTLLEIYLANVHQKLFQSISKTHVLCTNLWTGDREIFGPPDGSGKPHVWLQEDLRFKMRHHRHKIFGTKGKEWWYGGPIKINPRTIHKIWCEIEERMGVKRENYNLFPIGYEAMALYVSISVDDFSSEEGELLVSPEFGGNRNIIQKRKHKIQWSQLEGISQSDRNKIRDPSRKYDLRTKFNYLRCDIVEDKSLLKGGILSLV